jgi:short-subunit dehydrogenase
MRKKWLVSMGFAAMVLLLRRPRSDYEINGKVALVTGASSGIGAATAKALARAGATVVLVARREAQLTEVAAQINAPTHIIPADITQEDDLIALVEVIKTQVGRLDILINNAGVAAGGDFAEMPQAKVRQMIDVNVYGTMRLTQHCLPLLRDAQPSVIINVSSIAGDARSPGQVVYGATKAAMNGFSEALRRELSDTQIHLGTMMPGFVDTPMIAGADHQVLRDARLLNPFVQVGKPETIGDEIVWMIRQRRRYATTGGVLSRMSVIVGRYAPLISDQVFRYYFNKNTLVQSMGKILK